MTMRVGVVGLGVGARHVASYAALADCDVVAICDIDTNKLREVGDEYGVSGRFTDYREVTEDPTIDVVSICTYDDVHAEQVISCLRSGKHVMVEKPLALYREDAERIYDALTKSGRLLTSNLVLRTSPRFQEVKRQVAGGEFGDVFLIEGDYLHHILHKLTGGWRGRMNFYSVTYGGGVHLIDLMRWVLGSEISEVTGMSNKVLTQGSSFRFDDTTAHLFRFDNGALGKTVTTLGPVRSKFHSLNVYGTKRSFQNDLPHGRIFYGPETQDVQEVTTPYAATEKGALIPNFVDAIVNGTEPDVTAIDVFRVMDVCFASTRSLQTGEVTKVRYLT